MTGMGWTVFASMAGVGVLLVGTALWNRLRDEPVLLCPGPRLGWWRWVWPWRWFVWAGCRYELTRLTRDANDVVTCPECGTRIDDPRRIIMTRRWWSSARLGFLVLALAPVGGQQTSVPWSSVAKRLPNFALIRAEQWLGDRTPPTIRRELRMRLQQGELNRPQSAAMIELLIDDLHSDRLRGNADRAMHCLATMIDTAAGSLERALYSQDWQQRQLAATVLRRAHGRLPSDRLLAVIVEGLRDDALPYDRSIGSYDLVYNARNGVEFLIAHPRRAEPFVGEGLHSEDEQQRRLCAEVVARGKVESLYAFIIPEIASRLRSDWSLDDARQASKSLQNLGPGAIAHIEPLLASDDLRQREFAEFVLRRLQAQPRETQEIVLVDESDQ